jgi:hypothetical protein
VADPVRDFALDDDGDLDFTGGDRVLISGAAAVQQAVRVKVKTFMREIFLDESIGVDYLNVVLIKNPDPLAVREAIRERIASVADVTEVVGSNLELDRSTREATIRFQYRTVYSQTPVTDVVSVP